MIIWQLTLASIVNQTSDMKASSKLLSTLALLLFIASCGEDEVKTETRHEVGNWSLVNFALVNAPDPFSRINGRLFEVDELSSITKYTFSLMGDGKYTREIALEGVLPQKDLGTWTLKDDEFTFISDSFSENETLIVEKNEENNLWLSYASTFTLIPDSTIERLSKEFPSTAAYEKYFDELSDEEYDKLTYPVSLDVIQLFEKQ